MRVRDPHWEMEDSQEQSQNVVRYWYAGSDEGKVVNIWHPINFESDNELFINL